MTFAIGISTTDGWLAVWCAMSSSCTPLLVYATGAGAGAGAMFKPESDDGALPYVGVGRAGTDAEYDVCSGSWRAERGSEMCLRRLWGVGAPMGTVPAERRTGGVSQVLRAGGWRTSSLRSLRALYILTIAVIRMSPAAVICSHRPSP
jgi:hypothetical protein